MPKNPRHKQNPSNLQWTIIPLAAAGVVVSALVFDLGPYLLRSDRPGAALGPISSIYWATNIGYGVFLGLLWLAGDRALRGRWRALGWGLAFALAALLFSPDGVMYFANAFEFGSGLAVEGLRAMWPMAVGRGLLGAGLVLAVQEFGRRTGRLVCIGLAAGIARHVLQRLLMLVERPGFLSGGMPLWTAPEEFARAALEGALLGVVVALAAKSREPCGRVGGLQGSSADSGSEATSGSSL